MTSFEYKIDERALAGSRFISRVNEEIQRALATEKDARKARGEKLTQQAIADVLGVHRSVVNRRSMGLENLTARSIGELLWAIGWEPYFEAHKIDHDDDDNEHPKPVITETYTTAGEDHVSSSFVMEGK